MTEWEHEGKFFMTEGLLNLWWNPKVMDRANFGSDPPILREEVVSWMADHGVQYLPSPMVGPPIWVFDTAELRQQFQEKFLETAERMREIIDAGVAESDAEDARAWHEQGKPATHLDTPTSSARNTGKTCSFGTQNGRIR